MTNRGDLRREELVRNTLLTVAERLDRQDLKLADYLRLLQIRDEAGTRACTPIRVGWVSEWQMENERTDG